MKNIENNKLKINSKNIMISTILLICFIIVIALTIFYTQNMEFRTWIDINIFRKIVDEENTEEILLNSDNNPNIYAYSKYITILEGNELKTYNENGKEEYILNINVSNPIYCCAGDYLVIGDEGKQKAYLISGKNILWETEIEGNISNVYVNKNGYVVITIKNTSYKTVVAVYEPGGKQLFRQYLATTNVADIAISDDNSQLAIAEIDTSGILVQSKIKIISIEKAQKKSSDSVEYTYNSKQGNMIVSINYNSRNYLTCLYDNSIYIIKKDNEEFFTQIDSKKDIFTSVDLKNSVLRVQEDFLENLGNSSIVYITNILNKKENKYIIDSGIKEIKFYDDIISINFGTEVYLLNTSGYLIKKYTSGREIQDIVLTDNIVGIVYRDEIKIIKL